MKTRSKSRVAKPTAANPSPENFAFAATRIAVAQTIHSHGYNSAQTSALNTLASAAAKYIETLAQAAAASAVSGGRTQSILHDIVVGLETMAAAQGFVGASDLNRPVLSSSTLVELSRFVKYSLEIPFAQTIRREMPLPKTVGDEQSGMAYGHIPRWLPAIPLIERDVSRGKERRELYGCLASGENVLEGVNEEEIKEIGVDSVRDEKIGLHRKRGRVRFKIGVKEKGSSMGLSNGVCKLGKRVSCEHQLDNEDDNGNKKRRRKKKMMEWIDTLD